MATDQYVELAELAGGFIHEIKNHLSTLGLNLQLLAEDFSEPQSQRERRALERVQRLQGECVRLVEISNDFLRFARLNDLELVETNLADLIEEMVDFFTPTARQASIEIKAYLPADLPTVRLDCELFKQALLNLMLNAEQAMPQGGQLTIQAERIADCRLRIADLNTKVNRQSADSSANGPVSPGQSAICNLQSAIDLSLIDTGKGMTPEVQSKVFRPFFSTKPGGSGLGLPTVRKIVEAHGGQIEVQSELDRGTKFTIRLPTKSDAQSVSQNS